MVEISKYGSGEGSGGAILRTYSTGHDVPGESLNLMQRVFQKAGANRPFLSLSSTPARRSKRAAPI
jgi:hypothetical protein